MSEATPPLSPTASEPAAIDSPLAILLLTSHAHAPPLQPPAHLKYDLRSVENPPKALRDSHTGLSKRLREHLRSHRDFCELLDRAESEIREAMSGYDLATEADGGAVSLSVAAFCARGHHRSVGFVEELGGRKWPEGWEVRVVHRDLKSGREGQKWKGKRRGGGKGGREVGGFELVLEGDE